MRVEDQTSKIIVRGFIHDTEKVFTDQLSLVIKILDRHPELKSILIKEDIPAKDKKNLLEEVLKDQIDPQVFNLILMLAGGKRLHLLESIYEELLAMSQDQTHYLAGSVLSAFPLSDEMMDRLEKHFSTIMDARVRFTFNVDPTIIGGIIVTIGDRVFDGSIRNQLNHLKEHILQD